MSEEEIHKALEIIGQPITVNCKEYHYFDQENYDKLVAVYNNCLWFIRNFEQINTTVERVQQENKQLKERITYLENSNNRREETIISLRNEQQLDKYKEVIEKVKTEISSLMSKYFYEKDFCIEDIHLDKLLQILDKVK